jgi:hypothetical protein
MKLLCTTSLCLQQLRQDYFEQEGRRGHGSRASKGLSAVSKIREALNLMRNQKFEVSITFCG